MNKAGNPPKFEIILIPSTPAKLTMIHATSPIILPQNTFKTVDEVSLVELTDAMAVVFESAEVINDKNIRSIKNTVIKGANGN